MKKKSPLPGLLRAKSKTRARAPFADINSERCVGRNRIIQEERDISRIAFPSATSRSFGYRQGWTDYEKSEMRSAGESFQSHLAFDFADKISDATSRAAGVSSLKRFICGIDFGSGNNMI